MVETPRLEAKREFAKWSANDQELMYQWSDNQADHEHGNEKASELSFR
jgi:hypothetical protein